MTQGADWDNEMHFSEFWWAKYYNWAYKQERNRLNLQHCYYIVTGSFITIEIISKWLCFTELCCLSASKVYTLCLILDRTANALFILSAVSLLCMQRSQSRHSAQLLLWNPGRLWKVAFLPALWGPPVAWIRWLLFLLQGKNNSTYDLWKHHG